MLDLLKTHFGYDRFRPLQEEIIDAVLSKRDTLVLMPTGGGKSLCYQLPALKFDGVTLVVSPLIALMKDQVDALKANGVSAEFINSTLTFSEIGKIQARARQGKIKIIYLAPERLVTSNFREFLSTLKVSLIAIDEAHCISEWGHDFRPDYRNLRALRYEFPNVPVIALTATATKKVQEDIVNQLGLRQGQVFVSSFNRANLSYFVRPKREAFAGLVDLIEKYKGQPTIVYCLSRKDTENLAADLRNEGFDAWPYHAGLDSVERRKTQEKFIRDKASIIVATIAFGMGIDKPDIRLVVHYSLPKTLEGYYQETGRAGRDGLPSECFLFYSYGDKVKQDFFINRMEDEREQKNAQEKLAQVISFCDLQTCRRQFLMKYFGEKWEKYNCGSCDVCLSPKEEFDATIITQKILSAALRTGQRFGANYIMEVLLGQRNKKIIERGHDRLSVFGIVKDFSQDELRQIIRILLVRGLLEKEEGEYPILRVSNIGKRFLRERENIILPKPKTDLKVYKSKTSEEIKYDHELFEKLRVLRKKIADEKRVPSFIIFGDKSLQEMAFYLPQSLESFANISGVGKEKLAKFGKIFLTVISKHTRSRGL